IIRVTAHEAGDFGQEDAADALAAIAPGHGPATAVITDHHVVAVAQGVDPADGIPVGDAGEAGVGGDHAADSRAAVAPGRRPAVAVPIRTGDHVVAVAQGDEAAPADVIRGDAADQAVGDGDGAGEPLRAVAPGHGPASTVTAGDQVVAVGQGS